MKTDVVIPRVMNRGAVNGSRGRILLVLLLLAATGYAGPAGTGVRTEAGTSREYQVKAGFLFNFVQFVEWPATAFPERETPIAIGILGDDPFGAYLDEIVRGETVGNRSLVIRRSRDVEDLKQCHVLFISRSQSRDDGPVLAGIEGRSVLIVGETQGFTTRGGMINFFLEGNKVRFEVNPEAVQRRGLKISSRLLALARIVGPRAGKE